MTAVKSSQIRCKRIETQIAASEPNISIGDNIPIPLPIKDLKSGITVRYT